MDINRQKSGVALLSVVSNSVLVVLKLVAGIFVGSVSVISEAIHSGVDLLASVIALLAVRASAKPADREHPFGHGKAENISGTIEALLIFLAAGWIIYEAIKKLINPTDLVQPIYAIAIMLLSAVVNWVVSAKLFEVAKKTDSPALQADGWHLRTDVYTSAAVMLGLLVVYVGAKVFPGVNLNWIDPVAGIFVALLIAKVAYDLTKEAAKDLMDISLPPDELRQIKRCVADTDERIRGCHKLRTRKAGPDRFVEFHLLLDADMTVEVSHAITDAVIDNIRNYLPDIKVTVHVEPCYGECVHECEESFPED